MRVRVAAAALNPFDNFVVQGYMKDRMEHRFPLIPASDLAGTVDEVGPGADGFAVGDHVFGVTGKMVLGEGALAELTTATTATLVRRPEALSDVDAAAMALAGVSALMSVEAAALRSGDVVVVVGAAGGIGSYAVQLAALEGAHVIGVTSAGNADYITDLGAADVIDRTAGDVLDALKAKHPDGVASIIDTASDAPSLARLSEAVRKGGTITSMKGAAAVEDLAKRGVTGVNISTQVTTARLDKLAGLAAAGKLKAPRIRTFPLENSEEAFKLLGQSGGKLVVTV
ncbi:MAG: zinc-binding dehydrogenase [Actinomycetota bacterium]|nr:zinc-binding dehydrogenase [Actinomycetota bacterium]